MAVVMKIKVKIPSWVDKICAWPVVRYRQCKFGYPFRKIPLNEGKFTIVDPQDFYRFNSFDWFADGKGDCFYAVRFLISETESPKIIRLHREIMNAPADLLVDHRNNDGLDNRRSNLRLATHPENMQNRRKLKNTSSQYIGVDFDKESGKWRARIKVNGKRIYLGRFDSEIEAARAYDAAAKKYYGKYARLNFPEVKV